ncbi:MAG: uL15 family ribosomal protein [Clostridia bacterium]|nr:uL15 family ribosomal protein [Clostridia bacterium]
MDTVYIALAAAGAVLLVALIVFLAVRGKKKSAAKKEAKLAEAEKIEVATIQAENAAPSEEKAVEAVDKPFAEIADPEEKSDSPEVAPAAEESEDGDEDDEEDSNEVVLKAVVEDGNTRYIVIKYSKSFLAKLIQSDEVTKSYYTQLKNKLLSFKGVKSRISWKWETFRAGRKTIAKFRLRGKTLSLCFALNPDDYVDTKYHVESIADVKSYVDTPCLYRLKNDRRVKYSAELIDEFMRQNGIQENPAAETVDYAALNPYETTEALIGRNLIKVLTDEDAQSGTAFKPRQSVTAYEADSLMRDEVAETLIQSSGGVTDRTKQNIINIDTLSQCFNSGERVTLDEIKKRVKDFDKKTTYIKVLARGTLDKALTVEADNFSLQAVKMIVLTGGVAVKK